MSPSLKSAVGDKEDSSELGAGDGEAAKEATSVVRAHEFEEIRLLFCGLLTISDIVGECGCGVKGARWLYKVRQGRWWWPMRASLSLFFAHKTRARAVDASQFVRV